MADDRPSEMAELEGVVCPFHLAVVNPANAQHPGAPPPARVNERNRLTLLYRHARFHAGFTRMSSVGAMLIGILGGKKWLGVVRNLVTWSYDPSELSVSPLDKHPQNSGIVGRPSEFQEDRLERLLAEFGSLYTNSGGVVERGVSLGQLNVFLDTVAGESRRSDRLRNFRRRLANAELPVALKSWGTQSDNQGAYLGEKALRLLYQNHEFPITPTSHTNGR